MAPGAAGGSMDAISVLELPPGLDRRESQPPRAATAAAADARRRKLVTVRSILVGVSGGLHVTRSITCDRFRHTASPDRRLQGHQRTVASPLHPALASKER